MLAPFKALARSIRERGVKGTISQLYMIGDCKFGELKGTDKFGNKYYENLDYPFGQHRWVEYADIHNFDATNIQPEWHGWMHHMFDETPVTGQKKHELIKTVEHTDAVYKNHLGMVNPEKPADHAQVDVSQYRQRGYKIGSLMTGPDEPDQYYRQPGHPLSPLAKKGGRHQPAESDSPFADKDWKKKVTYVEH